MLTEAPLREETMRRAAEVARHAEVIEDLYGAADYKRHLLTVLAARALREAAAAAGDAA